MSDHIVSYWTQFRRDKKTVLPCEIRPIWKTWVMSGGVSTCLSVSFSLFCAAEQFVCSKNLSLGRWSLMVWFEKHTAPGAYSKHAPGAVYIPNMVLEHIWLKIINGAGPYGPSDSGSYGPRP